MTSFRIYQHPETGELQFLRWNPTTYRWDSDPDRMAAWRTGNLRLYAAADDEWITSDGQIWLALTPDDPVGRVYARGIPPDSVPTVDDPDSAVLLETISRDIEEERLRHHHPLLEHQIPSLIRRQSFFGSLFAPPPLPLPLPLSLPMVRPLSLPMVRPLSLSSEPSLLDMAVLASLQHPQPSQASQASQPQPQASQASQQQQSQQPLPSHVASLVIRNAVSSNAICPITMEPIHPDTAAVTNCGHVFQRAALQEWLRSNDTCPECRHSGCCV